MDPSPEPAPIESLSEFFEALGAVLEDGDALLIEREGDRFLVRPRFSPASELKTTRPQLYGALLQSNQRISDASGCGLFVLAVLGAASLCFGIHAQAFHGLFPDPQSQQFLEGLRSWWVYGTVAFLAFALWYMGNGRLRRLVYLRERAKLLEAITREGLGAHQLLTELDEDSSVSEVAEHLRRDPRLVGDLG